MLATRPRMLNCQPPLIAIESTSPATQNSRTSSVQGTTRGRASRPRHWIVSTRPDHEDGGDDDAVDGVVGVDRRRPRDRGAERQGVAEPLALGRPQQQQQEDRERRGGDQAEMRGAARDEHRAPGEEQPGEPRLGIAAGDVPRQQERGVARQHASSAGRPG